MVLSKKKKVALCLAGGGITGSMYEIGCLAALDDIFEEPCCVNQFDIFVGTSAGAVIAALVANGLTPRYIFDGVTHDDAALNFTRKNIYDLRWSEVFRAFAPLIKRFPSLLLYGWKNRKQASFMDLLSILQEFIPAGVFSLNNLDKYMAGLFYPQGRTNDFRNLKKELYIPATDLDTGERWVFGEAENSDVPISTAVAASAAIPLFFRPYKIKENYFIDGSTGKVAHVDIAIKHGARLIIIINPTVPITNDKDRICLPTFDGQCGSLVEKGMGFISDQARRIETKTRFELGFERFKNEHTQIDYLIIQPKMSDGILFLHGVMDFASRKAILDYGYRSTLIELRENLEHYQQIFGRYGLKLQSDRLQRGVSEEHHSLK